MAVLYELQGALGRASKAGEELIALFVVLVSVGVTACTSRVLA